MRIFKFEPIYKQRVWGGVSLRTKFNRNLKLTGQKIGESWEIVPVFSDISNPGTKFQKNVCSNKSGSRLSRTEKNTFSCSNKSGNPDWVGKSRLSRDFIFAKMRRAGWERRAPRPAEIHCKKGARKLVRASVEHASSNEAFVVLRSDLPFSMVDSFASKRRLLVPGAAFIFNYYLKKIFYLLVYLWSLHFALSKKIEKMYFYQQF